MPSKPCSSRLQLPHELPLATRLIISRFSEKTNERSSKSRAEPLAVLEFPFAMQLTGIVRRRGFLASKSGPATCRRAGNLPAGWQPASGYYAESGNNSGHAVAGHFVDINEMVSIRFGRAAVSDVTSFIKNLNPPSRVELCLFQPSSFPDCLGIQSVKGC